MSRLFNLALALIGATTLAACSQISSAEEPPCPVTDPNGWTAPHEKPAKNFHGNGDLWTTIWPDSTVVFRPGGPGEIREDGSLAMKFHWWRGPDIRGQLEITGRRLDGKSPPAYGEIPEGYGSGGFQATAIVFPSEGCWEIRGRVKDADLIFVLRVVRTES